MKNTLLVLSATCVLSGCAAVKVAHTDIATGATKPRAIYIRTFADQAVFMGHHAGDAGELPIRHSLAPAEFSKALKEEVEKLAPAMVLAEDEVPTTGWLIESNLELVDGGSRAARAMFGPFTPGAGASHVKIHVRVTDVTSKAVRGDSSKGAAPGNVLYEFDLAGGSRGQGGSGSIYAPGMGDATMFDYKNAAERVMMALSVDPHGYGVRTSPTIR